jgi:hypothetical protein
VERNLDQATCNVTAGHEPAEDDDRRAPGLRRVEPETPGKRPEQRIEGLHRAEAQTPGDVPERRMDDVDAVVEHMSDLAARHGDAGKLAVDGVEQRHHPAADKPDSVRAPIERVSRCEHQEHSEQCDAVRRNAVVRAPVNQHSRRPRPPPFRDEIGDPLVGVAVEQRFESNALFRRHLLEERGRRLAQVSIVARKIEHGDRSKAGRLR